MIFFLVAECTCLFIFIILLIFSDFGGQGFPGNFPNYQQPQDTITIHTLEAVDAHTVRLAFMVPRIIVGLHGRVEVRYTHDQP